MLHTKDSFIAFFRQHGFNCFPIPHGSKVADYRYQASRTIPNQQILSTENYGIIPSVDYGNAIIDFDNKTKYRKFAQYMIDAGYMVIETPHGWHIPILGISGRVQKTELFDYGVQQNKIIEIQGADHYCVGPESEVKDKETNLLIKYINRGSSKIWDAKGKDFNQIIDDICLQCGVSARKKDSRSSYKNLRDRFLKGEIPLKGSSNDYFHQAAIQCNTDGLTEDEAISKIEPIYQRWSVSEFFSGRTWNNILRKIQDVYTNNQKLTTGGRGKKEHEGVDRTSVAQQLVSERKFYKNIEIHDLYENKDGFLERVNNTLQEELQVVYPYMSKEDYNDIIFKMIGLSNDMPITNRDLIVFKNGVYDHKVKRLIESDDIADMGFRDYNYLPPGEENFPKEFYNIMFSNVPKEQHSRIKAGLRAIFRNYLDPKISIIYGQSGIGKSTPLAILTEILGPQYALTVELKQFLADKFISAKILGKRLLVFQDLPKEWKDFTVLKTITGEQIKTERGFMQDAVSFENKLKIWASGNYLAIIPDEEKDAMYTRRLSLVHNIRREAYKEDPELPKRIIRDEAEKIISWILNLPDEECKYEDKGILAEEWERIASPEIIYLEDNWQLADEEKDTSIMTVVNDCRDKIGVNVSIQQMLRSLKVMGYVVRNNIIKNIEVKQRPMPLKTRMGGLDE